MFVCSSAQSGLQLQVSFGPNRSHLLSFQINSKFCDVIWCFFVQIFELCFQSTFFSSNVITWVGFPVKGPRNNLWWKLCLLQINAAMALSIIAAILAFIMVCIEGSAASVSNQYINNYGSRSYYGAFDDGRSNQGLVSYSFIPNTKQLYDIVEMCHLVQQGTICLWAAGWQVSRPSRTLRCFIFPFCKVTFG